MKQYHTRGSNVLANLFETEHSYSTSWLLINTNEGRQVSYPHRKLLQVTVHNAVIVLQLQINKIFVIH